VYVTNIDTICGILIRTLHVLWFQMVVYKTLVSYVGDEAAARRHVDSSQILHLY
jgi:hypothetical protein